MSFELGLLAAAVSAIGWGSYFVPLKSKGKIDIFSFQLIMCLGIFVSSIIFSIFMGRLTIVDTAVISGIVWGFGNLLSALAVKKSGLSIAPPVWMGTGIFTSFVLGFFVVGEKILLILGLGGIVLLISGIFVISTAYGKNKMDKTGIIFSFIAGIIFGSYLLPLNLFSIDPKDYFFPMSVGILISGVSLFIFSRRKLERRIFSSGILSGFVWNVANFSSLFAVSFLGLSIGFPLTQLALFVSILWGLLYFKEFKEKNKIIKIIIGAVILFSGALLLSFAGS